MYLPLDFKGLMRKIKMIGKVPGTLLDDALGRARYELQSGSATCFIFLNPLMRDSNTYEKATTYIPIL
jgi:hypothetical protein